MRIVSFIALLAIASPSFASGSHYVRGYIRKDGTYVAPHAATLPNATKLDNWTTKGNFNPTTGQQGTVDPYKPTQANPLGTPYNKPRR